MGTGAFQNQQAQSQVYYDPSIGYYTRTSSSPYSSMLFNIQNKGQPLGSMTPEQLKKAGINVIGGALNPESSLFGKSLGSAAPRVDINALPQIGRTQNQPYQRPGMPPTTPGQPNNFTPQFDMQALMQAIQARQAMAGQPRQGTLTPGAPMPGTPYGGDTGGLAALRSIASGTTSAGE